ncbi:hypothetical protein Pmani_035726 [Petrolisthes manimaculis]|uniref:C2H2-type domain-containing protein n=1 Tax=Petrolisthes manimaculis TaxID=1843537 RepID=A0AAE1TNE3_9EUCA|nr:hypothetical protein Pmani_035726 [Petrolisthes manimaculis]
MVPSSLFTFDLHQILRENSQLWYDKVNDGEIINDKVNDGEIINDKVNDGEIINDKVNDGEIINDKVNDGEIINDKVNDGEIIHDDSVHSALLPSTTDTVHRHLCLVVGAENVDEACRRSEVLCGLCLKLLLNIVLLDRRVAVLRERFTGTFHKAAEARQTDGRNGGNNNNNNDNNEDGVMVIDGNSEDGVMVIDGEKDGEKDGDIDGEKDGDTGGEKDGDIDGEKDGDIDGEKDGDIGGEKDGDIDGEKDGDIDGEKDGDIATEHTNNNEVLVGGGSGSGSRQRRRKTGHRRRPTRIHTNQGNDDDDDDDDDEWTEGGTHNNKGEQVHVGVSGLECEICGLAFNNMSDLGQHRGQCHPSVYPHACLTCPQARYKEKAKLTQHMRRIHHLVTHICPGCHYTAGSQNSLDQHIIQHHPTSRYYQCHICNKAYRTHRYLHVVHIKRCHMGLPVKYTCDKCNKGFVDKSALENHKLTHSSVRNYTCEFCGAAFVTPYALKVHVNTHTQEKKYTCADCGTAFLRKCNLSAHRKRFHGCSDMRLVCEVCGLATTTQRDLRRHQLATHTKQKPFSCKMCHRSYTAKESLNNHLRTHTGDKPFQCECGKAFYKREVLRKHQRTVHTNQQQQQPQPQLDIQQPHLDLQQPQLDLQPQPQLDLQQPQPQLDLQPQPQLDLQQSQLDLQPPQLDLQPPLDSQATSVQVVGSEDLQPGPMVVITLGEWDSHCSASSTTATTTISTVSFVASWAQTPSL